MQLINPFPNKPWFLHVAVGLENTGGNGEIAHNEQL